jgi:hypothetical protein
MDGHKVGNSMGVNTWGGFAGTPDDALVVGDFAVLENELQAGACQAKYTQPLAAND